MTPPGIAPEARALLAERVHGFEQLEALLFLHGQPSRDCAVAEVAAALRIPPEAAARALEDLVASGLAVARAQSPPAYRFEPATSALHAAVVAVAGAYADQRLAVIKLMNENAIERLRTGATRAFADAFLIRRKNDG